MAGFSLDDVLASVLNSDDENDEFGLLDSSSENEEGQESSEVVAILVSLSQLDKSTLIFTIGVKFLWSVARQPNLAKVIFNTLLSYVLWLLCAFLLFLHFKKLF